MLLYDEGGCREDGEDCDNMAVRSFIIFCARHMVLVLVAMEVVKEGSGCLCCLWVLAIPRPSRKVCYINPFSTISFAFGHLVNLKRYRED